MKRMIVCCLAVILLFCSAACATDTKETEATQPLQTEPQRKDNVLSAWTGAFSEEKLKDAIVRYQSDYAAFTSGETGKVLSVSVETDFEVVQCTVSRLSKVNDKDMNVELNGYIDTAPKVEITGKTVTVDTGFWYNDYSWVNEWPVWSYLVRAEDAAGTAHYYYFRVAYSDAPILETAEDFETYIRDNRWMTRALGCTFEDPKDISAKFYFYLGVGANEQATGEELAFILNAFKEKNPDSDPNFGHNYIRLPINKMNEALTVLGLTVADIQIPEHWVYYDKTDAYYFWASDAYGVGRWKVTEIAKGINGRVAIYWQTEDALFNTVTGEHYPIGTKNMVMLLQRQTDGTYQILYNRPKK